MDDFQLKGIVEEKFVKWEYNSSSATERNSIAEENKAKADQPKDDTKKTETTNQSNARKEKYSVVSDSLRPHESQHARPPCPSPTPGVHSDSRPSSH